MAGTAPIPGFHSYRHPFGAPQGSEGRKLGETTGEMFDHPKQKNYESVKKGKCRVPPWQKFTRKLLVESGPHADSYRERAHKLETRFRPGNGIERRGGDVEVQSPRFLISTHSYTLYCDFVRPHPRNLEFGNDWLWLRAGHGLYFMTDLVRPRAELHYPTPEQSSSKEEAEGSRETGDGGGEFINPIRVPCR